MILQIKKAKYKAQYNQRLEEENQYLQKKLLENIEENGYLTKHKQDLIDQIQKLKDYEKAHEEMIMKCKNDKDSLEREVLSPNL